MSMNSDHPKGGYWRSLEALAETPEALAFKHREFPEHASELVLDGVGRRQFLGLMGASTAMAGMGGCVRKPVENIMPFAERPEDLVPGRPMFYASAYQLGASVLGIVVETQDGRPTKIEGNPKHSGSQGATDIWAQASVLDLYDPARSRAPTSRGSESDWSATLSAIQAALEPARRDGGEGLAFVIDTVCSPSLRAQLALLARAFPKARTFQGDSLYPRNQVEAIELLAGPGTRVHYNLERAEVILAADSDFLLTEADHVRLAREWSRKRKLRSPDDRLSRLYVIEPHFTTTGAMADNRVRMKAAWIGPCLAAIAAELTTTHKDVMTIPPGADALVGALGQSTVDADMRKFAAVVAADLVKHRGRGCVMVGERQPAWVHGIGLLINGLLGNFGHMVRWSVEADDPRAEPIEALAEALAKSEIRKVVCLGTNPAYHAPRHLDMKQLLGKSEWLVHAGLYRDETAKLAAWHVPTSHYLESWGDLQAADGAITICQPMILPLHGTRSVLELVAWMASGNELDGYSLVKGHWMQRGGGQLEERTWRRWLHEGLVVGMPRDVQMPSVNGWSTLTDAMASRPAPGKGMEIDFHLDPKLLDGRFANNAWLQELPHPMTKLAWDNAAYVSVATARNLEVENFDVVELSFDGRTLELPVFVAPGQADDTVSVTLGFARGELGPVAKEGVGFDTYVLRSAKHPWFGEGANVRKLGTRHVLANTQDHGTMQPPTYVGMEYPERAIVRETDLSTFRQDPKFAAKGDLMRPEQLKHLFDAPALAGKQQWGMAIDLNSCIACNACVVACQSENNIPIVGKKQVTNGRELHWIRIDRYYRGDLENPTAVVQPMACVHCETAPCETVCPVAATTHSPEGLNDMAYNRCIGTRYCSNNCPYKVRRFNFFNYNLDIDPLLQMGKNPDVTIRFRGVMEKCTYCVQRINQAKISLHIKGEDIVPDGMIHTACEQVCPTEAIVFGDIKQPDSRVSQQKRQSRNYAVLADLNTHPRTTYLARVRNPNPDLA